MPKCLYSQDVVVVLLLACLGAVAGCQRPAQEWALDEQPDLLPVVEVTSDYEAPLEPEVVVVSPSVPLEPLPTKQPVQINTYTIQRGDTLWSIAQRIYGNGKRWRDIVKANEGLDPTKLRVGQKVILP